MIKVEPHVFAVVSSSNIACEVAELLPECDLGEELKQILSIQHEILLEMIQGRHFGTAQLENFISYLDETQQNVKRIKYATRQRKESQY